MTSAHSPLTPKLTVADVKVPRFLYGTAWKEDRTRDLVEQAVRAGFRGIDTANQRKHYFEAAVGESLKSVFAVGSITRAQLFLQTKFTYQRGQDHRLPYDPAASPADQVRQSFASSLEHLGVEFLDSYVLHGPSSGSGLSRADVEVWKVFEELAESGKARLIGVSNFNPPQLEELCSTARIKPSFLQNRCYARMGWDRTMRQICRKNNICYQGFSLLTANPEIMNHPRMAMLANSLGRAPAQIVFRFAMALGMLPLTGTCDPQHMEQDLCSSSFDLDEATVQELECLSG